MGRVLETNLFLRRSKTSTAISVMCAKKSSSSTNVRNAKARQ